MRIELAETESMSDVGFDETSRVSIRHVKLQLSCCLVVYLIGGYRVNLWKT
jgi:hypothetical protein